MPVLDRSFYSRPTLDVARDLLGKVLVHVTPEGTASGCIVEAEAYIGEEDPACHAAPGRTPRNAPLYGPPGHAYVYFNYGMHHLVNAVTEIEGRPAAVLIRALAPIGGHDLMHRRRCAGRAATAVLRDRDLCRGPGNLTCALGIGAAQNRLDLCDSTLVIEDHGLSVGPVGWSPRIGIRVGTEQWWRAFVPGHPAVSGPGSLNRRPLGDPLTMPWPDSISTCPGIS